MKLTQVLLPAVLAGILVATACSDPLLMAPQVPVDPTAAANVAGTLRCAVNVHDASLLCSPVAPKAASGTNATVILGGQDLYVKLSSEGTSYDGGTQILSSNVSVQNLVKQAMGTPDGSTATGVRVFFSQGPTVTSGSGTVTVANADGTGAFTAANQPYFEYTQILQPYEISTLKSWQFNISGSVVSFVFGVYVSADLPNEATSKLDKVWSGANSTDFSDAANWQGGVTTDSASAVMVLPDSAFAGAMPALTSDADILHLRVGYASTFDLATHLIRIRGNLDVPGTIQNGTIWMTGTGSLLRGTVSAINISGSTSLQGATKATGAVQVTGSLTIGSGKTLNIAIP